MTTTEDIAVLHRIAASLSADLADGGVTAAAIEAEVVSPGRARSLVQENTELRARIGRVEEARDLYRQDVMTAERREQEASDRAERAEKERDRWREYRDGQATENPRPLTADDLGPEHLTVRRAAEAYARAVDDGNPFPMTLAVRAALTPPPSRPEGAAELADDLSGWDEMDDYGNRRFTHEELDDLADHLAARGWTKGEK